MEKERTIISHHICPDLESKEEKDCKVLRYIYVSPKV